MLALTMPAVASGDDDTLTEVCAAPLFAPHLAVWQDTYKNYRRRRGNEFGIDAVNFDKDTHKRQVALYKSRKGNPVFRALRETCLKCCPMCGSPGTGALDHHLPEGRFGEFAILLANLVPSCGHCNSGSKGTKGQGATWPERFLHPYYDRFAEKELWRARVSDPLAPVFIPEAEPSLRHRLSKLIQYNLDHLLGWQFRIHLESYWASLPTLLAGTRTTDGHFTTTLDFDAFWKHQYFSVTTTEGLNGWKAALLRGIRDDAGVRAHLLMSAATLPVPV
jgi:5-methylcytosine-specific restriction endonuclease McrA